MFTSTVTTLIENIPSDHKSLACEHGLSFHINTLGMNILFDCGASGKLIDNADALNIDLGNLDLVVLSHGHYDHGNGFRAVAEKSRVKRLVTGQGCLLPKFSRSGLRRSFLGVNFDSDYLEDRGIRHEVCGKLMQVNDNCWLIGEFQRNSPEETISPRFVLKRDGMIEPDAFADEICLALRMDDGLAVFVGCSHPGIVNMLEGVRERLRLPIRGVWGGSHLVEASEQRLKTTLDKLKRMGVRHLGLTHCSGEAVQTLVENDGEVSACRLNAGDSIEIAGRPL